MRASFLKISADRHDGNTDQSLSLEEVEMVVKDCLGLNVPLFTLDKFIELSRKNSVTGKISWNQFRSIIPIVSNAVEAECRYRRELPALMVLMNRPRIVDNNLGSLGEMSSTYRDNFNASSKIEFKDNFPGFAYTKVEDTNPRTALNKAAKILCAGTVKGTHQLPGFKGHIPANVRNVRKKHHSDGSITHEVANNLRLTQRGMGCVLGYTGHVPHETSGPREERKTACDPRTSNGAAFGATRAFL